MNREVVCASVATIIAMGRVHGRMEMRHQETDEELMQYREVVDGMRLQLLVMNAPLQNMMDERLAGM